MCEKLAPADRSTVAGELYLQKGPAPLSLLLDAEGGETAFGLYAEAACSELTETLRATSLDGGVAREKDTYVTVFGHSGFLHAVAYAVATAAGILPEELDRMIDINLGEAEGILIPLYGLGKAAIHLKRPN